MAVFWDEGNDRVWYLGVAEEIFSTGNVLVNHFKRANVRGCGTWVLPEEKNLQTVEPEQIIARIVNAMYLLSGTRVKCIVDKDDVELIREKLSEIASTLLR